MRVSVCVCVVVLTTTNLNRLLHLASQVHLDLAWDGRREQTRMVWDLSVEWFSDNPDQQVGTYCVIYSRTYYSCMAYFINSIDLLTSTTCSY